MRARGRRARPRVPPPWLVRELAQAFVVQAVAYFRHDPNETRQAKVLTHDAANIAKPLELLSRGRAEQMQ